MTTGNRLACASVGACQALRSTGVAARCCAVVDIVHVQQPGGHPREETLLPDAGFRLQQHEAEAAAADLRQQAFPLQVSPTMATAQT
ncbi:hypothetical protein F183_A06310 [Bryobacterales bacterium F-183]|nr:hypothetical protein F183_A06310 [Bryobacterales bacterium F-183]